MSTLPQHVSETSESGLTVDYLLLNEGSDGLVVLMSNALVPGREDRSLPAFHRWSWAAEWPEFTVLVFADPALRLSEIPDGAWYMHRDHDTIRTIAAITERIAGERGIPAEKVVFYGSSLGGFGALAAAAATGARAVAEVPQIDVQNWFPGAVQKIERHVLLRPMDAYRRDHPERVSVWSRFLYERCIPAFTIYTNEQDKSFRDQLDLVTKVRSNPLYSGQPVTVVVTARTEGHQVLDKAIVVDLLRREVLGPS